MKIAVLSGKGGTGKTTVAASLAVALSNSQYIDCDVEEPNGALFIRPEINETIPVNVLVPKVDEAKCDGCGACAKACRFNALAVVKKKVLLFPAVCHHCGACAIACPQKAITEAQREIGVVEADKDGRFLQGRLNIGEPITIPIIHKLKQCMRKDAINILDCSPGASCTVVQTIDGCDYCILVTEPTPFGLHDLKIAVALVRKMSIPFGVVLNKAMDEDQSIQTYCMQEKIPVLMEIPFLREIAENYSKGFLPVQMDAEWGNQFMQMFSRINGGEAL
ncbi:MAG TPA: ATP-binding protein [Candidatus Limiplasma sp.]|nr:ATP-binding protein [Candidatus Limiplasma sp.]